MLGEDTPEMNSNIEEPNDVRSYIFDESPKNEYSPEGSPCQSPIKNFSFANQDVFNAHGEISPGIMKQHIKSRLLGQIESKLYEIEQNSPSKNSNINRDIIQ